MKRFKEDIQSALSGNDKLTWSELSGRVRHSYMVRGQIGKGSKFSDNAEFEREFKKFAKEYANEEPVEDHEPVKERTIPAVTEAIKYKSPLHKAEAEQAAAVQQIRRVLGDKVEAPDSEVLVLELMTNNDIDREAAVDIAKRALIEHQIDVQMFNKIKKGLGDGNFPKSETD